MYERKTQPLAPPRIFYRRVLKSVFAACAILGVSLLIGILGYHSTESIPWIDAIHNASMILSGMGPVVTLTHTSSKVFSSFYALFSGIVFITNIGVILAPLLHRLYHRLHLEEEDATS